MAAPHNMQVNVRHVYDDEVLVESFDGDYIFRLGKDAFPEDVSTAKKYHIKLVVEELPPYDFESAKDNLRRLVKQIAGDDMPLPKCKKAV